MKDDAMRYLAVDLGASSGRVVLGTLEGDVMHLEELHRFVTPLVEDGDHLYWDIDRMWDDIRLGVARGLMHGRAIRSIAVDSWAVDYVPLDTTGSPLRRPYSYRDRARTGEWNARSSWREGASCMTARESVPLAEHAAAGDRRHRGRARARATHRDATADREPSSIGCRVNRSLGDECEHDVMSIARRHVVA